ncbi:MAG: hypothetical protein R6V56_04240 [Lentisphaeria bacterium]
MRKGIAPLLGAPVALLGVFVLSCTTFSGNVLQLETPRRVAAAPTRRARVSFGDLSSFRRKPLAYG